MGGWVGAAAAQWAAAGLGSDPQEQGTGWRCRFSSPLAPGLESGRSSLERGQVAWGTRQLVHSCQGNLYLKKFIGEKKGFLKTNIVAPQGRLSVCRIPIKNIKVLLEKNL